MVNVDISGIRPFLGPSDPDYSLAVEAHRALTDGTGKGSEYTGWLDLPKRIFTGELKAIAAAAQKIRSNSQALVVIGIGGSYLGARAAVELLRPVGGQDNPDIYFAGNGLSPDEINRILNAVGDRDFSVNVVSKSGTTLEPALSFRVFRSLLEQKYGKAGARKRIYATTDAKKGALKTLADTEGYETFTVPDDVGGRYSVLSAVGLLPMAVAGIDITRVITAAIEEMRALDLRSPENPAWQYAASRQCLYRLGKTTEIMAYYDPPFRFMGEWYKQLFGESEGKDGVGIFPASVEFTADLHSMGQFIQDGPRDIFETVITYDKYRTEYKVPFAIGDPDGLNYLAGRDFGDVTKTVIRAVREAHISGGVPNIALSVPEMNEEGFASLVCFFEMSCALSGYISGVNPFDQPGVEAYKKNMFRLLKGE